MHWAQCQRRSATPAAHHLCRQQFFILGTLRVFLQIPAKVGDTLMELAKDDVSSVSSENFRLGLLNSTHLIGIAQDKLARFEGLFLRIGSRNPASFNCRMADPVPEPKRFCSQSASAWQFCRQIALIPVMF